MAERTCFGPVPVKTTVEGRKIADIAVLQRLSDNPRSRCLGRGQDEGVRRSVSSTFHSGSRIPQQKTQTKLFRPWATGGGRLLACVVRRVGGDGAR
ncbi:hypothetical protein [Streptomyces sp. NPDC058695]|uniref:hypothetical protein n=1 Tax=Streptomyces sp. NPDC058695 TaxID=3346604 RepID=UPI003649A506